MMDNMSGWFEYDGQYMCGWLEYDGQYMCRWFEYDGQYVWDGWNMMDNM